MINRLMRTLETINKIKNFKRFKIELNKNEIKDLYIELLELQKNLDFMIDKNDNKAEEIDRLKGIIKDAKIKSMDFYKFGDPEDINDFLVELYEILDEDGSDEE